MFQSARLQKLIFDRLDFILKVGAPFIDNLMNEQVTRVKFLNGVYILLCLFVEIKVAYFSCEVLKDHGVSHLPDGKRATLEEFLNSELVVLEKHHWPGAVI